MTTEYDQAQLLSDIRWFTSEFGLDHWRNCDDDDCYLCEGYHVITDRYDERTS
jgi:hypothetical protein